MNTRFEARVRLTGGIRLTEYFPLTHNDVRDTKNEELSPTKRG